MQKFFRALFVSVVLVAACHHDQSPLDPAPAILRNAKKTTEPEGSLMTANWPFKDAQNTAVITLTRIMNGSKPILYVVHDDEGDWQFLDGDDVSDEDATTVSLKRVVDLDSSVGELADTPKGWAAERDAVGQPWRRYQR